ncbi:hypothetical protein EAG_03074 [Camponotus floridanus]|uniref:Uncharacterized protein n=1 Tax=Camponotus floridanus TaxID=104421 RepID=E1ZYJ1_CAMFO|nr:hypothetical protein EAG_03074 [Camponotus floridanus]
MEKLKQSRTPRRVMGQYQPHGCGHQQREESHQDNEQRARRVGGIRIRSCTQAEIFFPRLSWQKWVQTNPTQLIKLKKSKLNYTEICNKTEYTVADYENRRHYTENKGINLNYPKLKAEVKEKERNGRKRLRLADGQQRQKTWYPSGLSSDQQNRNKGTRRKWTKGAASLIPLLHVTENARPSGIMPRFPATAGRTVALAIRDFILWGVSPLCSTIILPAVHEERQVLTGNGDEQEEYPRIHESADGEEATAAAGWEGSPPVHHAPRRIADLAWDIQSLENMRVLIRSEKRVLVLEINSSKIKI